MTQWSFMTSKAVAKGELYAIYCVSVRDTLICAYTYQFLDDILR